MKKNVFHFVFRLIYTNFVKKIGMNITDFIMEVVESFRAGRRRFVLASVTTVFGVFLLVVLVGASLSVTRGIKSMYLSAEKKSVSINAGKTSLLYQGRGKDIPIWLDDNDVKNLALKYSDEINYIVPMIKRASSVSVDGRRFQIRTYGVNPGYLNSGRFHIFLYGGRDIDNQDISTRNKVCLISDVIAKRYFDSSNPERAISENIEIDGVLYQIKGVFKGARDDVEINYIFIPAATVASLWNMEDKYTTIELDINVSAQGLQTPDEEAEFKDGIRQLIAHNHSFDYHDKNALIITDRFNAHKQTNSILGGLRMTILLFCILILISGIFGVSNILFISIRERTYEIVLRRLMGASDANIFSLVICESVLIMFFSSILGIFLAEGALHIIDSIISEIAGDDRGIWSSFVVDIPILVGVMLVTIISGVIAGLAPARKAVRLKITQVH